MPSTAISLSENIRQLRTSRGLSQQQCAQSSGIPRPTWTSLESGRANPTLQVLIKVAAVFQVSVEELIRAPKAATEVFRSNALKRRRRGGGIVFDMLPRSITGLHIERLELPPDTGFTGAPHTPGTREYLVCERGCLQLVAAGEQITLKAQDVVSFRGDQKHSYKNPGRTLSVGYSVIALAPV